MKTHHLKTWPEFFQAVLRREKTFEVRKDDRPGGFHVGDWLRLAEWDPEREQFTGYTATVRVCYYLPGGQFGIEPGYCVLGIER